MIRWFSTKVPVEIFAFVGSFLEEVIAPIPSPLVMTAVGSIAFSQHHGYAFLLWLSLIGAVGKTLGAWVIYFVAFNLEDILLERFGRFLGVSKDDIAKLGKYFKKKWKDFFVLFLLRNCREN